MKFLNKMRKGKGAGSETRNQAQPVNNNTSVAKKGKAQQVSPARLRYNAAIDDCMTRIDKVNADNKYALEYVEKNVAKIQKTTADYRQAFEQNDQATMLVIEAREEFVQSVKAARAKKEFTALCEEMKELEKYEAQFVNGSRELPARFNQAPVANGSTASLSGGSGDGSTERESSRSPSTSPTRETAFAGSSDGSPPRAADVGKRDARSVMEQQKEIARLKKAVVDSEKALAKWDKESGYADSVVTIYDNQKKIGKIIAGVEGESWNDDEIFAKYHVTQDWSLKKTELMEVHRYIGGVLGRLEELIDDDSWDKRCDFNDEINDAIDKIDALRKTRVSLLHTLKDSQKDLKLVSEPALSLS